MQNIDIPAACRTLMDVQTAQKLAVLKHFERFDVTGVSREASQNEVSASVQDTHSYVAFMRMLSNTFFLSCEQLIKLLHELPRSSDPSKPHTLQYAFLGVSARVCWCLVCAMFRNCLL
jgi:hypothetical protein